MAQQDTGAASFQKLLFLIRDWPNAEEVSGNACWITLSEKV